MIYLISFSFDDSQRPIYRLVPFCTLLCNMQHHLHPHLRVFNAHLTTVTGKQKPYLYP